MLKLIIDLGNCRVYPLTSAQPHVRETLVYLLSHSHSPKFLIIPSSLSKLSATLRQLKKLTGINCTIRRYLPQLNGRCFTHSVAINSAFLVATVGSSHNSEVHRNI